MIDLIVMTATANYDNLLKIIPNVAEKQKKFPNINLFWLICEDQYNGKGDMEAVMKALFERDLRWLCYKSGKPNQPNYGGDMYNEPLEDVLKEYYGGKDPWIYILDDDNILTDRMFFALENEYDPSGKRIAWMHYLKSNGETVMIHPDEAFAVYPSEGYWLFRYNPDPSSILFKASVFLEFGGFNGGGDYDYTSCREMCLQHADEIKYDFPYDPRHSTYHNGLRTAKTLEGVEQLLNEGNFSGHLYLQNDKDFNEGGVIDLSSICGTYTSYSTVLPILKKETIKKIYELIKKDYEEV